MPSLLVVISKSFSISYASCVFIPPGGFCVDQYNVIHLSWLYYSLCKKASVSIISTYALPVTTYVHIWLNGYVNYFRLYIDIVPQFFCLQVNMFKMKDCYLRKPRLQVLSRKRSLLSIPSQVISESHPYYHHRLVW